MAPISKLRAMALAQETKAIVAQFEYSDDDVNKGVKEFLRQMGTCAFVPLTLPSIALTNTL